MIIANATVVLPFTAEIYQPHLGRKTPQDAAQLGQTSLFEDNAEFGFGFRISLDKQAEFAAELLQN